jgi:hypothetical protein
MNSGYKIPVLGFGVSAPLFLTADYKKPIVVRLIEPQISSGD